MKKILLSAYFICAAAVLYGQTVIQEEVEVSSNQIVHLDFEYANLVNIRGWDGSTVKVSAKVLINMGKNDDAYLLESTSADGKAGITGYIKDKSTLPQMISIHKDGQTYYFEGESWDSPELQKFYAENGREGYDWMSHGVAWEIELEVMVPNNVKLEVTSKHGLIDIENFAGNVKATSKHGGVDFAIHPSSTNHFNLLTQWGVIYTDLDFAYQKKSLSSSPSSWTSVESSLNGGKGALIDLESKHGNLYVRQAR